MNNRTSYVVKASYLYHTIYSTSSFGSFHRNVLQAAIDEGKLTEPGEYIVFAPDGKYLNAMPYTVEEVPRRLRIAT